MIAKPAYMNDKHAIALVAANAGKINPTGSVITFFGDKETDENSFAEPLKSLQNNNSIVALHRSMKWNSNPIH